MTNIIFKANEEEEENDQIILEDNPGRDIFLQDFCDSIINLNKRMHILKYLEIQSISYPHPELSEHFRDGNRAVEDFESKNLCEQLPPRVGSVSFLTVVSQNITMEDVGSVTLDEEELELEGKRESPCLFVLVGTTLGKVLIYQYIPNLQEPIFLLIRVSPPTSSSSSYTSELNKIIKRGPFSVKKIELSPNSENVCSLLNDSHLIHVYHQSPMKEVDQKNISHTSTSFQQPFTASLMSLLIILKPSDVYPSRYQIPSLPISDCCFLPSFTILGSTPSILITLSTGLMVRYNIDYSIELKVQWKVENYGFVKAPLLQFESQSETEIARTGEITTGTFIKKKIIPPFSIVSRNESMVGNKIEREFFKFHRFLYG